MGAELIQGQHLANQFLALLPAQGKTNTTSAPAVNDRHGSVPRGEVPSHVQLKLAAIFAPLLPDNPIRALFNGDLSLHNNDHSAADLALAGYMARQGLTQDQADHAFRSSALYRPKWDEMRGDSTYGQRTLSKVFEDILSPVSESREHTLFKDASAYRANYVPGGMPARRFVGPCIGNGMHLFPAGALSALVSLGAGGKTTLLISIAAHLAAGKSWNGHSLQPVKVAMFFVEEAQEELDRKVSATIDHWTPAEQRAVFENLLLVSLLGTDARLIKIERGHYQSSGVAEQMIGLLESFGLRDGLVVLDHMQGFACGDLNISETATSICREANKIVDATGAAVVFAAHISKANIGAESIEQGFAVGSLAFENATRQLTGMIAMPEEDAKKFGLEATRKEYVLLGTPKNSYGGCSASMWLRKVLVEKYNTVVMVPVTLTAPISAARKSANEKLEERLMVFLESHLWITRNQLDKDAGEDGPLKASKSRIRDVLKGLMDDGAVEFHTVTDSEREEHNVPKQVKQVLRISSPPASPPNEACHSKLENSSAALKAALGGD